MRYRFATLLAITCLTLCGPEAVAQELSPGDRVRVQYRQARAVMVGSTVKQDSINEEIVGIVGELRADSLRVTPDGSADNTSIPLATVSKIEVSRGTHDRTLTGMAIGTGIGFGAGFLTGVAMCSGDNCEVTGGEAGLVIGAIGAGAGLLIGTVIGALSSGDDWQSVSVGSLRVTLGSRDLTFRLAL